jgi:hypothetical protein
LDEEELRQLMHAAEVPPSGADVLRAIATGRRRARGRTLLTRGAAGVAVVAAVGTFVAFGPMRAGPGGHPAGGLVAPPPRSSVAPSAADRPSPGATCKPHELPRPAGATGFMVTAIDPTGARLAGWTGPDDPKPVVWSGGTVTSIPGASGVASAIAADGTVVGSTLSPSDDSLGWVWRNGTVTNLARLSGYQWTNPSAINATGTIAGWVHGATLDQSAPVIWKPDGTVHKLTVPSTIGNPGTVAATARDIADDGTVVGDAHGVPVMWKPDGTPVALTLPSGANAGFAWAVAGPYAYGDVAAEGQWTSAVRWNRATGAVTVLPDTANVSARDGTVDGTALVPATDGDHGSVRLMRLDGSVEVLHGVRDGHVMAVAISPDGRTVAGASVTPTGVPLVWHCS